jgi:hypothetical protein
MVESWQRSCVLVHDRGCTTLGTCSGGLSADTSQLRDTWDSFSGWRDNGQSKRNRHKEEAPQMAVITRRIDPDWHESRLIIQLLNRGAMLKTELLKRVREEQKEKSVLGEKGITHSDRAYEYWLKKLIDRQIAIESAGRIELTALGEWVANPKPRTLEDKDKYLFIENLTCRDCGEAGYIVVLKIAPNTAVTNSKGALFMDTECPRCGHTEGRRRVDDALSATQFISFYGRAISGLQRTARALPQIVLPS